MQGTQYAPRESILCMEHFVALQSTKEAPPWNGKQNISLEGLNMFVLMRIKTHRCLVRVIDP